jgi:uncharacterized protein YkwD
VSSECAVCGADVDLSDACSHCGATCCAEHRSPSGHGCPGLEPGTADGRRLDLGATAPERRPPEQHGGPIPDLLRSGLGLAVATAVVVAVALGAVGFGGTTDGSLDAAAVETAIADRAVEERLAAGAGPVATDPELAAVARAHSRDMRERGYVNHTSPGGDGPQDRVDAAGLDCLAGENIYFSPRGAAAGEEERLADHVVDAWLDSPGHRETLLRGRYTRQGIGVAFGDDAVYVTQLFC